jgi:hypothetical protein
MKPPITLIPTDKQAKQKQPDDKTREIDHDFTSVHANVSVALSLLYQLQDDVLHLPEVYHLSEALGAIIQRIGYVNTHAAHLVSPGVLDEPDADMWMPTLGLTRGKS